MGHFYKTSRSSRALCLQIIELGVPSFCEVVETLGFKEAAEKGGAGSGEQQQSYLMVALQNDPQGT